MPIYAYKCESCGHSKDVLQKMSDAQLTVCPNCGAHAFKKQLTAAGFQLKGSGWYVTDFKGGGAPAAPASDQGGENGAAAGGNKAGEAAAPASPAPAAPGGTAAPAVSSPAPAPVAAASPASSPAKGNA